MNIEKKVMRYKEKEDSTYDKVGPYGYGTSRPYDDSAKPDSDWENRIGPYGCGVSTPYGE